jgi:cardiolipin synthase A/B
MKIVGFILLAFIVILFLLYVDFKLGRRHHLSSIFRKNYPIRQSHIDVFTRGDALFNDFFSEVEHAKQHIHVLFYILKDDPYGRRFLQILKNKALEGVEVRLLLDWAGSFRVPKKKLIQELKKAGIHFAYSHKPKFPYLFYRLQVRNHRKISVIDGKIGYIGGFNVGKEYLNEDPKLNPWRDYHLKIKGEGVHDLQREFLHDWDEETNEYLIDTPTYFPEQEKGPIRHQLIPSEGFYLEETFSGLLRSAEKSIQIGSPYFIPSKRIYNDLLSALDRGVEVTVLVPKTPDHPFVKEASFPFLRKILAKGGNVYEYVKGFYHAKILIIDDRICDSGTANFDQRSFFLNHEINCYMFDPTIISQMKSIYETDIKDSIKMSLQDVVKLSLKQKLLEWVARPLSYFL